MTVVPLVPAMLRSLIQCHRMIYYHPTEVVEQNYQR